MVKSIKTYYLLPGGNEYGTQHGTQISVPSLICIILYTDYTDLATSFSSTFRMNGPFETLESVKKRNQNYYWFAKGLKQLVHSYGQSYKRGIGLLSALKGPFFCGLSFVLLMPAFNIKIFGPTSTSKQKEVAIKFSGDEGIIVQFDNQKGMARCVRGFDVSFISRYGGEEDER